MFAVASNLASTLLAKPTSLSSYTLHSAGPSPAASPAIGSSSNGTSAAAQTSKGFIVGLWRVVGATHKTTNKDVSVWMFDKRVLDGIKSDSSGRPAAQAREWVVEQLKKEASSLTKLRHPDILHMVEPLEETRSELTFVTEYVTSSLYTTLHRSSANDGRHSRNRPPGTSSSASDARGEVDLDEVEIQKGVLQIARGLGFLHGPAKSVHRNLTPQAILINAKGDWKLSGLGLTTPLQKPDGSSTRYEYPEIDHRLPGEIQWKLDYLAPEYALDSQLSTSNDLYSLGCVLYALHMGGKPPYTNSGSMQSLRDHVEGLGRRDWASGPRWERCSAELKDLLPRLLTRQPSSRLSLASLPSHPFFSSLAISTLNFLDPTTFASKPREEKATYLRGLVRVLPSFSDRLRRTKILPSLLEEMKDSYLLPFILPNVFEISKTLSKEEFTVVLPKLQPLFALKDPPQNMLTLLENLTLFEEKTIPAIFRENVMPLIYNSIECEHLPVQEKVLKLVPHLCEILDYGTVHNILLVKVAMLFTRTRVLSVKVLTLETFRDMVTTLDKTTLTTKLVPLLAKIKTKEPAVMMATLGVQEAMGAKVDREAIATLVLPQLWSMSMGPLLNATQFDRFMAVIRSLGDRVAKEHGEHLKDVRRLEESQNARVAEMGLNGWDQAAAGGGGGGEVDFEALVKGSSGPKLPANDGWGEGWDADDGLSEMFGTAMATTSAPAVQPRLANSPALGPDSGRLNTAVGTANRLKARPIPSTSFNASAFDTPAALPRPPTMNGLDTNGSMAGSSFAPLQPTQSSFAPMQPTSRAPSTSSRPPASSAPNYNLSLSPQPPAISVSSFAPLQQPAYNPRPPQPQMAQPIAPAIKPPPGYSSGLMQPSKPAAPAWGSNPQGNGDWGDFDPFK